MNNDLEFYQIIVNKYLRDMLLELEDNDFFNDIDCINIYLDGITQNVSVHFLKDYEEK